MAPRVRSAAAHAQDNAFGLNDLVALAAADAVYLLIGGHFQHHGAQFHPHAGCAQHLDIAPGVFRAGKLLAKPMQAKPVVDALVQNTAQLCIAFQNQNIAQAMLPRAVRRRQARRAAADDNKFNHGCAPFRFWFHTAAHWCRLCPAIHPTGQCLVFC